MYELASRRALHDRARKQKKRRLVEFLVSIAFLALWWVTLAPQNIGGPLTYAVVSGTSMEPDFFSGDLIVAKVQSDYQIGDSVIYEIYGGFVVHQIISESSNGYRTQGVNNNAPDSWTVARDKVKGKLLASFPGVGQSLVNLINRPLVLGAVAAAIAGLLLLDFRPRKASARLKTLLAQAKLEPPPEKWAAGTWLSSMLFIMALGSLIATSIMLTNGVEFFPRVALTLAAAVAATVGFEVFGFWLSSGQSLDEPYRSIRLFGHRLYLLREEIDIPGKSELVDSAKHLHTMAEVANSTVVHIIRDDGHLNEFWLITDDLNYFWRVAT